MSLKRQEHRGQKSSCERLKKEQFPVPRNITASKIGNGVSSLV